MVVVSVLIPWTYRWYIVIILIMLMLLTDSNRNHTFMALLIVIDSVFSNYNSFFPDFKCCNTNERAL